MRVDNIASQRNEVMSAPRTFSPCPVGHGPMTTLLRSTSHDRNVADWGEPAARVFVVQVATGFSGTIVARAVPFREGPGSPVRKRLCARAHCTKRPRMRQRRQIVAMRESRDLLNQIRRALIVIARQTTLIQLGPQIAVDCFSRRKTDPAGVGGARLWRSTGQRSAAASALYSVAVTPPST